MAFGLTKVDAVNAMLEMTSSERVTGLGGSGSWPNRTYGATEAGKAEMILDRVSREVQARGFERANVVRWKKYTVSGSPGGITLASNVLSIKPVGPSADLHIGINDGNAYDFKNDTATFAVGDYFLDVTVLYDFEKLPHEIRQIIQAEAVREWQRVQRGSVEADQMLSEKHAKAEYASASNPSYPLPLPTNTKPMIPQGGSSERRQ